MSNEKDYNLSNAEVLAELRRLGACAEGIAWAAQHGGDLRALVTDCSNIDHLRWWLSCQPGSATPLRLFACDCAARVLPIYEAKYPDDMRPREAIETARLYARGEVDSGQLAAAGDAAWDATWGTGRVAARDAALATVEGAAWAAWSAARDAAWDAAGATAWKAEREWQMGRLRQYILGTAADELEALRSENARLREALGEGDD